ncbi:MAG: amidase [Armatimonadota bacterium]|nr:amidase [Armatimonadota bacterium]MDR7505785.1 amidase [Armatimonadota bacterium]MDR7546187.1 amidase [Armatimonadota bacterium]
MPSAEPHRLTALQIAAAVRSAALSPVAVVEACLAQIARLDPQLQAWVHVDGRGALEQARRLDSEARAGFLRGPLHGVPVALKDIFDVAGMVTGSGAGAFAHRTPERDARCAALLRQAGAIMLGKTVTTPFAFADPSPTRNPWNLDHTPGGSSSGSAAGVAARMVPLALGSQTIGSTIRPAAYCGVVGFKGSYGAISLDGVTPLAWSLDHVGIFARTVDDAALVFAALAEPSRPPAAPAPAPPRLGIPRAFLERYASEEVGTHLEAVARTLSRAGATIGDVALPDGWTRIDDVGRLVLRVEAAAYHHRWFPLHADAYPPKIRELVSSGQTVSGVDYLLAQEERARFRKAMTTVFESCDFLLLPAAPAPAPPLAEGTTGDPIFCAPWSFTGLPSLAVPSGLARGGLPLAVQLVAPMLAEDRLLDAARWCERVLEFTAEPALLGPGPR